MIASTGTNLLNTVGYLRISELDSFGTVEALLLLGFSHLQEKGALRRGRETVNQREEGVRVKLKKETRENDMTRPQPVCDTGQTAHVPCITSAAPQY